MIRPPDPFKLHLARYRYSPTTTQGILSIDGVFFAYTLEDTMRLMFDPIIGKVLGDKVMHKTAIPAGEYIVSVNHSARFDKMMTQVHNVPQFSAIRLHGGNDHADTDGCPLMALSAMPDRIQGGALERSNTLTNLVHSATFGARLIVVDTPVMIEKFLAQKRADLEA